MALWALGALSLGAAVYVLDRQGKVLFLPSSLPYPQAVSAFTALGAVLPSMAHTFAFVLFTEAAWASTRRRIYAVCALWVIIETAMEAIQLQVIAQALAGWSWTDSRVGRLLVNYSTYGTFSFGDVVAIGIGALAAAGFVEAYSVNEVSHESALAA